MKYLYRAIIYYPLLLTLCLALVIILFLIALDLIWNFKITNQERFGILKRYFTLFHFENYIDAIENGFNLITINFRD